MLQQWEVVLVLAAEDAETGAPVSYGGSRAHVANNVVPSCD